MIKDPTTAPTSESKPPITIAGRALKAVTKLAWVKPLNPHVMKNPDKLASIAAINHTRAITLPTFMPWARDASWSKEVALIASPYFENLKNIERSAITPIAATRAVSSRYFKETPPILRDPKFPIIENESPMYLGFKPIQSSKTVLINISIPIVSIATEKTGSPTIALRKVLSITNPRIPVMNIPNGKAIQNDSPLSTAKKLIIPAPATARAG